ncbi:MAG: LptA/OstA family protein [Alphaproteobacteria bacterium]|jgi:lipopolysaccharide export system protein LptA
MTQGSNVLLHIVAFPMIILLGLLSAETSAADKKNDAPQAIEIEADNGIEWVRDEQMYIAKGNARAARGDAQIFADQLTAYYRSGVKGEKSDKNSDTKSDKGGQDIFRVDADGNVRVVSKTNKAFGDKAVYHVDQAVFVLVGESLRLVTNRAKITARDSLEYWETRQLAVARGRAIAISAGSRITADILTAHINEAGQGEIKQIDAFGNVVVSTRNVIARGAEGVYNPVSSVATLCGGVKITRGGDQLNGECAEVNLKSGKSRLIGGGSRVKGLLTRKK